MCTDPGIEFSILALSPQQQLARHQGLRRSAG
jgi:hypothetical protein